MSASPDAISGHRASASFPARTTVEASVAILETVASENPELVDFQVSVLLHSTLSFTIRELATTFDVSIEEVGQTLRHACQDLDRLEKYRRLWRDPRQVIESVHLTALLFVCRARLQRIQALRRRQRLETILRRVEKAYELAQARAWIDDFIGPLPTKAQETRS